jgi:hypothetical protein
MNVSRNRHMRPFNVLKRVGGEDQVELFEKEGR